jgi:hypothetical protein
MRMGVKFSNSHNLFLFNFIVLLLCIYVYKYATARVRRVNVRFVDISSIYTTFYDNLGINLGTVSKHKRRSIFC